jgi:5-methylcytosine-specific restriction endonuclease McrA
MWLFRGSAEEIKQRKLLFTKRRAYFEQVLIAIKDPIIRFLGRKGGPSRLSRNQAELFDRIMNAIELSTDIDPETASLALLKGLDPKIHEEYVKKSSSSGKPFAAFTQSMKAQQEILAFYAGSYKCELCGGAIELGVSRQVDHIHERRKGGTNDIKNGRIVHPWCNNNREKLPTPNYTQSEQVEPPMIKPIPELTYNQIQLDFDV